MSTCKPTCTVHIQCNAKGGLAARFCFHDDAIGEVGRFCDLDCHTCKIGLKTANECTCTIEIANSPILLCRPTLQC